MKTTTIPTTNKLSENKIEKELRYVLSSAEYEKLKKNAMAIEDLTLGHAVRELTVMYDNPNPDNTFYSKEVDGRLRVRTSKPGKADIFSNLSTVPAVSMLTWKQRIPQFVGNDLNQEREVEVNIDAKEMDNMIVILEDVLHCPRISSYERNRETFYINGVEVASDTFPYGHVVELELKDSDNVEDLYAVAKALGLDKTHKSTMSCDDMYKFLCEREGIVPKSDILFNDEQMPGLDAAIERGDLA